MQTEETAHMLQLSDSIHPSSFYCPLTMEVMEDPVMDMCAHCYERNAITEWIRDNNKPYCPISHKPLHIEDLKTNHVLAERIEKWKWTQEHDRYGQTIVQTDASDDCNSFSVEHGSDVIEKDNAERNDEKIYIFNLRSNLGSEDDTDDIECGQDPTHGSLSSTRFSIQLNTNRNKRSETPITTLRTLQNHIRQKWNPNLVFDPCYALLLPQERKYLEQFNEHQYEEYVVNRRKVVCRKITFIVVTTWVIVLVLYMYR